MDFISSIKFAANALIFGRPKGKKHIDAYDCANHVNRSYNYLWKIADMNSEQPIPVEVIVPIMKLKNDYKLLELIAWECGGVFVRLPGATTKGSPDLAAQFQLTTAEAASAFIKALNEPTKENVSRCLDTLKKCAAESYKAHKYIEQKTSKQLYMEF